MISPGIGMFPGPIVVGMSLRSIAIEIRFFREIVAVVVVMIFHGAAIIAGIVSTIVEIPVYLLQVVVVVIVFGMIVWIVVSSTGRHVARSGRIVGHVTLIIVLVSHRTLSIHIVRWIGAEVVSLRNENRWVIR